MATQRPESFYTLLRERTGEVVEALNAHVSSCGFPVYSSIDVRDAGWKLCAVDVNLFPAGWNNLSPADHLRAANKMREFFAAKLLSAPPWRITVVPEAHTNNAGYLENLAGILKLLREAQCEARLLWPGDPIPKAWKIVTRSGDELNYLPAEEALKGAQALLLNHDLSGGIPKAIADVHLPTFPSTRLGWYRRRKSKHQEIVDSLLRNIERKVDWFDPWYFTAKTRMIPAVNFEDAGDRERIHAEASAMIDELGRDYAARDISEKPRLFIKNDAGTYGMGVASISELEEIREGSRRLRNKMRKGKEAVPITQIILQEAVPTSLVYNDAQKGPVAAEPAVYMINGIPVGGFLRIHEGLGPDARWDNLNQPGSLLEPLDCANDKEMRRPFPKPRGLAPCEQLGLRQEYGFLARLHATAAGLEDCPG